MAHWLYCYLLQESWYEVFFSLSLSLIWKHGFGSHLVNGEHLARESVDWALAVWCFPSPRGLTTLLSGPVELCGLLHCSNRSLSPETKYRIVFIEIYRQHLFSKCILFCAASDLHVFLSDLIPICNVFVIISIVSDDYLYNTNLWCAIGVILRHARMCTLIQLVATAHVGLNYFFHKTINHTVPSFIKVWGLLRQALMSQLSLLSAGRMLYS